MRLRFLRRLAVAGLLALILLLSAAAVAIRSSPVVDRVRGRAEAALSAALGRPASIGSLTLHPLGRVARLGNVLVAGPTSGAGEPLLRADEIVVGVRLRPLLAGRVELSRVEADGLAIALDRDESGAWSWLPPPADGEAGREVRLAVVAVRRGTVRLGDDTIPLDVELRDVSVLAGGTSRALLQGRVEVGGGFVVHPRYAASDMVVTADFRLTSDELLLQEVLVSGPMEEARVWGRLGLEPGLPFALEVDGTVELSRITGLPPDLRMAGELSARLDLTGDVKGYLCEGSLSVPALETPRVSLADVESALLLSPGSAELRDLSGRALGGRFAGGVTAALGAAPAVTADVNVTGSDLSDVLDLVGQGALPLAGEVGARLALRWNEDDGLNVRGDYTVISDEPPGPSWPLRAAGMLVADDSTVELTAASLALAGAEGSVRARRDETGVFTVALEARSADLGVLAELARALEEGGHVDVPDIAALGTLSGRGTASVSLTAGPGRAATLDATVDLASLRAADTDWGAVTGRVRLDGERVRFEGVQARRDDGGLFLDGWVRRDTPSAELALTARAWDLGELSALLTESVPLAGHGDLDVALAVMPDGGMEGEVVLGLGAGRLLDRPVERADVRATFDDAGMTIRDAVLEIAGGRVGVEGVVPLPNPDGGRLEVTGEGFALATLAGAPDSGLAGSLDARGRVSLGDESRPWNLDLEVEARDVALGSVVLGDVRGTVRGDAASLDVALRAVEGAVQARGDVALVDRRLDVDLTLDGVDLVALSPGIVPAFRGAVPSVLTRGGLRVEGPLDDPGGLRVAGTIDEMIVDLAGEEARTTHPFPMAWDGRGLRVGPVKVASSAGEQEGSLGVDAAGGLDGYLRGDMDLRVVEAVFPDLTASGRATVDITLAGTLDAPGLSGALRVAKGRLRHLGLPQPLEAIEATVLFAGSDLRLDEFTAVLGGGKVTGSGQGRLAGVVPESYRLRLDIQGSGLDFPPGFRGLYEGTLDFEGDAAGANLSGRLDLVRGRYRRDIRPGETLLARSREFEGAPRASREEEFPVRLDVRLSADDSISVNNDVADLEGYADLAARGTASRPEIDGTVGAFPGGIIRFRGVEYEIDDAILTFSVARTEPDLLLRARTIVRDYEIILSATGPLSRLDVELTSNPPLSQEDVVSLLVSGQTVDEIADGGAGGGAAARLAGQALSDAIFGDAAQRLLGVDQFEIRPSMIGPSSSPTTRLLVGKSVSRDVRLLYSRDVSGETDDVYQILWNVWGALRLVAEQSETGSYGADLRGSRRLGGDQPRVGRRGRGGPPVTALRLEGRRRLEDDRLLRDARLQEGKPFTRSALADEVERLRLLYAEEGFLAARVEAEVREEEGGVDVTLRLEAGPRHELVIEGVGDDEKEVRRRLQRMWAESLFTEDLLSEAQRVIRSYFQARGYYTVFVEAETEESDAGRSVIVRVDPGPLVRVREVAVEGNTEIPEARIRQSMLTVPHTVMATRIARTLWGSRRGLLLPKVMEDDAAAVTRLYHESGYPEATVEITPRLSAEGDAAVVLVAVSEGRPYVIERIEIEGLDAMRAGDRNEGALRAVLPVEPGDPYGPTRIRDLEAAVTTWVDARGYPDAAAIATVRPGDEGVVVALAVRPGSYQEVGAIDLRGARQTRHGVIRRNLEIRQGSPLTQDALTRTRQRLSRLGLFSFVRLETEPMEGDEGPARRVTVTVREASRYSIQYGVGYDTDEGPRISFGVSDGNFLGRNQTLSTQLRYGSKVQRARVILETPGLLGRGVDGLASTAWSIEERDDFDLERLGATLQVRKSHTPRLSTFYRYTLEDTRPTDLRVSLDEFRELEPRLDPEPTRLGSVGFGAVHDGRDSPVNATEGTFLSGELSLFADPLASERQLAKLSLNGSRLWPVGRVRLGTGVRLGFSDTFGDTGTVPVAERFFLGGPSTLRGFGRDDVIPVREDDPEGTLSTEEAESLTGGEALFLINQELQFPIWKSLEGVVFYDAGNIYQNLQVFDPTDLRHVLGVGLRISTPVGPLRIEYGRKLDREEGESSGEFFLAIGQVF